MVGGSLFLLRQSAVLLLLSSAEFEAEDAEMLLALQGLPRPGMHSRGKDVAQLIVTAESVSADWAVLDGHGSVWQPGQACRSVDGPGCLATARFFRQRQRARLPLVRPLPRVDIESAVGMVETMMSEFQAGAAATTETSKEIEDAHTAAATLISAGIDTYHLSTWTSDDFYGDTIETVLLLKVQQPGASPGTILTAVKQTGDTRVPGGLVSWVALGAPAVGGAALNGVVQIRPDPDNLSKFSWAKCVVQLLTPSRIVVTMPGFGHSGSFALNVDETLGASADEDVAEAAAEADDEGMHVASFGGVMLPEWTEDVYDGLAGEWALVEVWRRGAKQRLEQPPVGSEQVLIVGRPEGGVTGLKVGGYLGIEIGHVLFRTTGPLSDDAQKESHQGHHEDVNVNEDEDEEQDEDEEETLGSTECWVQLRDDDSHSTVLDLTKRQWIHGTLVLVSWNELRLVSYRRGTSDPTVELELVRVLPLDI